MSDSESASDNEQITKQNVTQATASTSSNMTNIDNNINNEETKDADKGNNAEISTFREKSQISYDLDYGMYDKADPGLHECSKMLIEECNKSQINDFNLKMIIAKNIYATCLLDEQLAQKTFKLILSRYTCCKNSSFPSVFNRNRKQTLKRNDDTTQVKYTLRPKVQSAIRELMLEKRTLPTYSNLVSFLKRNGMIERQFHLTLWDLGYRNQNLPGTDSSFIVEEARCVRERFQYLKAMRRYRYEDRYLVYVEMGSIAYYGLTKAHRGISKYCTAISPTSGILAQIQVGDCADWLNRVLVPMLPVNSVLIMEEEERERTEVSRMSTKAEMIVWLERHGIPHRATMHRAELFELIDRSLTLETRDRPTLLNSTTTVLYRPRHMLDYSINYVLYQELKQKEEYKTLIANVRKVDKCFELLTKDADWLRLDFELAKKEKLCLEQDGLVEELIDTVLTMVHDGEPIECWI